MPRAIPSDKPVEFADDLMDCTRYLCMGVKAHRPAADLPKSDPTRARPVAAGIRERQF